MKLYELTYLISPEISEQDLKYFSEKINGFITKEGGIFDRTLKPIKKNLAYPIQKKTTAYLQTINFSLTPEKIKSLKASLGKEKDILRFVLIGKKVPRAEKIRKARIQIGEPQKAPPEKEKTKEEKVELEKIDKKLEEILGNI